MSSELKSETARINGAKSHGPITPEGKARSSANSRRHGLAAASIVLPGESAEHFQLLLADYRNQFQPQTGVEADLVEVMAVARWRLRRLLVIETHQLDLEMVERKNQIEEEFTAMVHDERLAYVFKKLSDNGNTLALLLRYEASINRSYDKAWKQLLQLQSSRPVGSFCNPSADLPNQESPSSPAGPCELPDASHLPIARELAPNPGCKGGNLLTTAVDRGLQVQYSGFSPLAGIDVGTPGVPA